VPELPETETIARGLQSQLSGARIVGVRTRFRDVLRSDARRGLRGKLSGAILSRSWRRAKTIVLDLSTGWRVLVQPRFTGRLIVVPVGIEGDDPYTCIEIDFEDGRRLEYRDVRRLGTVALLSSEAFDAWSAALGPEPLAPEFDSRALSGILRVSRQAVKKVLMDQRKVAGVGNIYANEALWRAGIDPSRSATSVTDPEAERLRHELVSVLTEAVAMRGTSFRDYRDSSGERGSFSERLAAYGRGGLPCPRCGTPLVMTHAIDGRSTVFCYRCQR
jgi:formamidopyrimidine-DNA glycosylase